MRYILTLFRHPRESGGPAAYRRKTRDSRFRGNDGKELRDEDGFTLVELMVVIVILGLLATIVVINVMPAMDRAAATAARANISQIEEAVELYKLNNGRYPTSEEGLQALVAGRVIQRLPNDPWNNAFLYSAPGQDGRPYSITTLGADGREGGTGENEDISN